MNDQKFESVFQRLTGHPPLRWQMRLFRNHFAKNELPSVIDLSTGLGKTMVMAVWLIARGVNKALPCRLVYVVDRRTVVDQATDLAKNLVDNWTSNGDFDGEPPAISTLRGQRADNREWSRDPSRPAIIIGTVDLIGSALLFSGYRSSYKRRPLEAGLLGQDSLLVLDEAHLSKPFEKLITSIAQFQRGHGAPMQVIRMSATSSDDHADRFKLETADLDDSVIKQRFQARKRLRITTLGEKEKLNDKLRDNAIELAANTEVVGKRIVVFVRRPEDATVIADLIRKHAVKVEDTSGKKAKMAPATPYENAVETLTGTMRGLERDELVEKPVLKRFLDGDVDPADAANQQPVFLISTSAGEVGFDLNADHMVCDAAPLDSMIQRLGRVNRRGLGDAIVRLVLESQPKMKNDIDAACIAASMLLRDDMDVSPRALAEFTSKLSAEQVKYASTPEPTMVELTDILLDAWSMTSITEQMPGRPEVAPWLRGVAEDLPQTTIAWRAELDLRGFDQLATEDIEEWFDTHRILTHETLSVPTTAAAKWITDCWANLSESQQHTAGMRSIVVDRAGLELITVQELVDQIERKRTDTIRNAQLIVPASFGGIERGIGLLDPSCPSDEIGEIDLDEEPLGAIDASWRSAADVADERGRYRELVMKTEDEEPVTHVIGAGTKPAGSSRLAFDLVSGDDRRVQLLSFVPKRDKLEWGSNRQTLATHVELVRKHLDEDILAHIELPESLKLAVRLAAEYHDQGKNRERWQRCAGRHPDEDPLGKSGGRMKRDPRGYRHEFGSLRNFIDVHEDAKFTDSAGVDITYEVIDLALHLIATHHGRGRPHFPRGGFDPDCESRSDDIYTEVIRRFARLQRKYGWWRLAWLENLLRCADALASADTEMIDDTEGFAGGNA